jgi:hypothetical protein
MLILPRKPQPAFRYDEQMSRCEGREEDLHLRRRNRSFGIRGLGGNEHAG